jgi:hypothetical protein
MSAGWCQRSSFPFFILPASPSLLHKGRTLAPHGDGLVAGCAGWGTTNDCAAVPVRSWRAYRNGSGAACLGLLADCHSELGSGLSCGAGMGAVWNVRGVLCPCRPFPFLCPRLSSFPPFSTPTNAPSVPTAMASSAVERAVHGVEWQEHASKWRVRWWFHDGRGTRAECLALDQGRAGPV